MNSETPSLPEGYLTEQAAATALWRDRQIRLTALCVVRRGDAVLVCECYDPNRKELFYRPVGGAIEFGEWGCQAAAREIQEEIGGSVTNLRFLGAIENIFAYSGDVGHEIALVYEGEFADSSIYNRSYIQTIEGTEEIKAVWKSVYEFGSQGSLHPPGLADLLNTR